jgi:hypothetical protein
MPTYSRFNNTKRALFEGNEVYGTWNRPRWLLVKPPESEILTYLVSARFEGRPDLISNALYGTTSMDWVIVSFNLQFYNHSEEVFGWPKAGTTIWYPTRASVMPFIL